MAALKASGGKMVPTRKYKIGDQWSSDFDYDGMLAMFRKAMAGQMSVPDMKLLFSSMEDVNYHTEARRLQSKIDEVSGKVPAQTNAVLKESIDRNLQEVMVSLNNIKNNALAGVDYADRVEAAMGSTNQGVQSIMRDLKAIAAMASKVEKMVQAVSNSTK